MKNLTFILFVVILASCGNKKAEIVERIKIYKDSVGIMTASIVGLTIDDTKKYEELYYSNGEPDYKKVGDKKLRDQYNAYLSNLEDKKWKFNIKKAEYQGIIDSLELELKKY